MIDDIALFIHLVRHRSLAVAAKELNLPAATVTRRLQKLETSLGCKLIHRSARKFELTSEGQSYFQAYSPLVMEFEETARNLSTEIHQLSGPLKVLAPTNISIGILQKMWAGFIKENPNIQLNVELNNVTQDILSSQVDIALRIGPQNDSSLYQKRLGSIATIVVASPEYLSQHGIPESLNDLNPHHLIKTNMLADWELTHKDKGACETIYANGATIVNDIGLATQLCRDGVGIALLPYSEIHTEISEGKLVRVLNSWVGPNRDIYAIWPSGRLLSAKAKSFRHYMTDYISNMKILQGQTSL